jgi:hypothetical protein
MVKTTKRSISNFNRDDASCINRKSHLRRREKHKRAGEMEIVMKGACFINHDKLTMAKQRQRIMSIRATKIKIDPLLNGGFLF